MNTFPQDRTIPLCNKCGAPITFRMGTTSRVVPCDRARPHAPHWRSCAGIFRVKKTPPRDDVTPPPARITDKCVLCGASRAQHEGLIGCPQSLNKVESK
jgi:hypothetical protein